VLKGKKMCTFFVQREIDVKESSITEWAYVFMEGVHVRERDAKHSNHVIHYGEVEGQDDNSSIDPQL
jgi:hypothetical protein